jgi:hypothetical protein
MSEPLKKKKSARGDLSDVGLFARARALEAARWQELDAMASRATSKQQLEHFASNIENETSGGTSST